MPMNVLVDDVLSCGSDYLSVVAGVGSPFRRYCRKKMEVRSRVCAHVFPDVVATFDFEIFRAPSAHHPFPFLCRTFCVSASR